MGVGKTIQALAVACVYQEDWPLVIICPSSLKFTWHEEIMKWMPWIESKDICIIRSGKDSMFNDAKIYVLSYDLATKMCSQFQKRGVKMVIADEAHYMKAHDVI